MEKNHSHTKQKFPIATRTSLLPSTMCLYAIHRVRLSFLCLQLGRAHFWLSLSIVKSAAFSASFPPGEAALVARLPTERRGALDCGVLEAESDPTLLPPPRPRFIDAERGAPNEELRIEELRVQRVYGRFFTL